MSSYGVETTAWRDEICFLTEDWRAFADGLAKAFPFARYAAAPMSTRESGPRRPSPYKPDWQTHLLAAEDYSRMMCMDPNWEPVWIRTDDNSAWVLSLPEAPIAYFTFGYIDEKGEGDCYPPRIGSGYMVFRRRKGSKHDEKLVQAVRNLLAGFARNRDFIHVEFPSYQIGKVVTRATKYWIGHYAMKWLQADWRRMAFYFEVSRHGGFRPSAGPLPPDEAKLSSQEGRWRQQAASSAWFGKNISPRTHFRSRYVALLRSEWVEFARALGTEMPEMKFRRRPDHGEHQGEHPPHMRIDTLLHFFTQEQKIPWCLEFNFDPAWTPNWYRENEGWRTKTPEMPSGYIYGYGYGETGGDERYLGQSEIHIRCRPDHKNDFALARRFYKMLERFTTNRDQVRFDRSCLRLLGVMRKGSDLWVGHEAIEWAKQDPLRFISGTRPFGASMPVSEYAERLELEELWGRDLDFRPDRPLT